MAQKKNAERSKRSSPLRRRCISDGRPSQNYAKQQRELYGAIISCVTESILYPPYRRDPRSWWDKEEEW